MLGTLKTWLHNGPHRILRYGNPRLSPIRTVSITQRRLNSSISNNTADSDQSSSKINGNDSERRNPRTLWLLASIASSVGGYALATVSTGPSVPDAQSAREPQYGTPADFSKAIEELRSTFPSGDSVSTDPDDLYVHGFSEYDYHPGKNGCTHVYSTLTHIFSYQLPSPVW